MPEFWSWWIIVLTLGNIAACYWLVWWTGRPRPNEVAEGKPMHHEWDGIRELNNPLPRWWLYLFYITIVFGVSYAALYPLLGKFPGLLGWTAANQYDAESKDYDAQYAEKFNKYLKVDLKVVAKDPEANKMGQRLFLTYCASCHGTTAQGATHFPNLTDKDWLYGGEADTIKTTVMGGRLGVMPNWGPVLGEQGVDEVANYVQTLSGRKADATKAAAGKVTFTTYCTACHGPDGKGNQMMGAPNLTDGIWLHGASDSAIRKSITNGFNNQMPSFSAFLGEAKVHLLAAYVYSLSNK